MRGSRAVWRGIQEHQTNPFLKRLIPTPFLKTCYSHAFISQYYYLIFVSTPPKQKVIPGLTTQHDFEDQNWLTAEKIVTEILLKENLT